MDMRDIISATSSKKLKSCRSFHFRYMELCRAKNLSPINEIRCKNNVNTHLEFCGDKLGVTDWMLIIDSLYYDQVLHTVDIRLRKSCAHVITNVDTEKKARLFRERPVIHTKFIFNGFLQAICKCIELNKNLKVLHLEGFPLADQCMEPIAKALSCNESIKDVSFARSSINDEGCKVICGTIKYLDNVENINISDCDLTARGAEYVAEMIKIQKISRYTEGWQKSLRYRDIDPDSIPGLRFMNLARNQKIGDDGARPIIEILKDDVWIKAIDLENCGLSDVIAHLIIDCLDVNIYITDINVRNNPAISKFMQRSILQTLGKDDDEHRELEPHKGLNGLNGHNGIKSATKNKQQIDQMRAMEEKMRMLQEQLSLERLLRKKAELLNEKLNQRIQAVEHQLENDVSSHIPDGYVIIKNEVLESVVHERDEYKAAAAEVEASGGDAPINGMRKMVSIYGKPRPGVIAAAELEKQQQTTAMRIRKVKSEIKYMEPAVTSKKVLSKSDHEFTDAPNYNILPKKQLDRNIGDTAANDNCLQPVVLEQQAIKAQPQFGEKIIGAFSRKKFTFDANDHGDGLDNVMEEDESEENICERELDVEELSICSKKSNESMSDESNTLRNDGQDYNSSLKVFISRNRNKSSSFSQYPMMRNGEQVKSPRSLFLGCD